MTSKTATPEGFQDLVPDGYMNSLVHRGEESHRAQVRAQVAYLMRQDGYHTPARNYETCREHTSKLWCEDCQKVGEVEITCDISICDRCAEKRQAQVMSKYRRNVLSAMNLNAMKFMTLTMPNTDNLAEGIDEIRDAFNKLRRRQYEPEGSSDHRFGDRMYGGIYAIEANWREDGWNVHMHVLYEGHRIDQEALSETWEDLTGAPVVDIRRADDGEGRVSELCKYLAKPPFADQNEPQFSPTAEAHKMYEYFKATYQTPMAQVFGKFHHATEGTETISINTPSAICPHCGSENVISRFQDPVLFEQLNIGPDLSDDPPPLG